MCDVYSNPNGLYYSAIMLVNAESCVGVNC